MTLSRKEAEKLVKMHALGKITARVEDLEKAYKVLKGKEPTLCSVEKSN